MSLSVNHLNADSTFLLTFAPPFAPTSTNKKSPGTFTVLVDPWLEGHYTVWRPSFAIAYHTKRPSVASLADMKDMVDVIVVSQEKADHCHKESLCSLPRNTTVKIVATPAAAKKIWSWKYFTNPNIVHVLPPYHPDKPATVIRFPIEPYSSRSAAGEVTFANMPSKVDMAHLHNAIGITYCPPSTVMMAAANGRTISLANLPVKTGAPQAGMSHAASAILDMISDPIKQNNGKSDIKSADCTRQHDAGVAKQNHERVLSVLYSPHGVSRSTVQPYVNNHLAKLNGALPLTALFHSVNVEANPWFMGGIVSSGAPGGAKLAKALRAKYWIGAHDELKDCSGMAVRFIRKEQFGIDTIYDMLKSGDDEKAIETEVAILDCGEERRFTG